MGAKRPQRYGAAYLQKKKKKKKTPLGGTLLLEAKASFL
jgi:hypothetical protein